MSIRIPYGRQTIGPADVEAVSQALRSDWLTQGPKVQEFERALASYCGAAHAVVYSNGTEALQGAYHAAGLRAGDEFVTTPLTFAATANAGLWHGAVPVFADVDPRDGNLDAAAAAKALTPRTKAVVPVHYAGKPVDLDAFRDLARSRGLVLIEDACHALGATYKGRRVGSIGDMTVFSFHPVKSITTGEGGAVLTNDPELARRLTRFRQHGIERGEDWEYAVEELGVNARLTDLQSALGLSQLSRLDEFIARRRALAARYATLLAGWPELTPPASAPESAWHLYPLRLAPAWAGRRREVFRGLREEGIGVQVHYIPVHRHPLYRSKGYAQDLCPNADDFYAREISLPLFPTLTDAEQSEVVAALRRTLDRHAA